MLNTTTGKKKKKKREKDASLRQIVEGKAFNRSGKFLTIGHVALDPRYHEKSAELDCDMQWPRPNF
jgi:hypothetical protein